MELKSLNLELKKPLDEAISNALTLYYMKAPFKSFEKIIQSSNINKLISDFPDNAEEIAEKMFEIHTEKSKQTHYGKVYERIVENFKGVEKIESDSKLKGIDYKIEDLDTVYFLSHKSGANWANSSQGRDQSKSFERARESVLDKRTVCINTCSYGVDDKPHKDTEFSNYYKLCGQRTWEFLSGDPNFYSKINASIRRVKKDLRVYDTVSTKAERFLKDFKHHCTNEDGTVNWDTLLRINSSKNSKLGNQDHLFNNYGETE